MQEGLPNFRADSSDYSRTEQFDRWCAGVAGSFDVRPPANAAVPRSTDGFGFSGHWWRCGALLLGEQASHAHDAERSERHVRADQMDHYRLILRMEGLLHNDAGGAHQVLQPGELLINDMSRPERMFHESGKNIVLVVPREMLDEALACPLDLHGNIPRGAGASLLVTYLHSMVLTAPAIESAAVPMLTQATLGLIAASLAPNRDTLARAAPIVESTRLRQMCRYIEMHLVNPDLSADQLAGFFHVSRATLYRMFEPMGGVAAFIRERRLARMHALLASSKTKLSIGRLAQDNGFRNATHFSRVFREQYGYSPKDIQPATAALSVSRISAKAGQASLVEWMRVLRD